MLAQTDPTEYFARSLLNQIFKQNENVVTAATAAADDDDDRHQHLVSLVGNSLVVCV